MKTLFIDMDGVLADFENHPVFNGKKFMENPPQMYEEGFFESMPVVKGALSSVRAIINSGDYDVHILSQPVRFTHFSHSEKASWIWKWFPELGEKIHLSQDKKFFSKTDRILLDDNRKWMKPWEEEGGRFLLFDKSAGDAEMWDVVLADLLTPKLYNLHKGQL